MILSDNEIRDLCLLHDPPMIEPFSEPISGGGIISYGITSAGYDVRLCNKRILVFMNAYREVVDPKQFNDPEYRQKMFTQVDNLLVGEKIIIPPNGYILGQTYEYIRIPRNISGRVYGKSTLARSGILINCTPAEPEWEGNLTLEIGNLTPSPAVVYALEGIAQFQFELINRPVGISYKDKKGQYQHQKEVTPARVRQ